MIRIKALNSRQITRRTKFSFNLLWKIIFGSGNISILSGLQIVSIINSGEIFSPWLARMSILNFPWSLNRISFIIHNSSFISGIELRNAMFTWSKSLKLDLTKDLRSLYPTGYKPLCKRRYHQIPQPLITRTIASYSRPTPKGGESWRLLISIVGLQRSTKIKSSIIVTE